MDAVFNFFPLPQYSLHDITAQEPITQHGLCLLTASDFLAFCGHLWFQMKAYQLRRWKVLCLWEVSKQMTKIMTVYDCVYVLDGLDRAAGSDGKQHSAFQHVSSCSTQSTGS